MRGFTAAGCVALLIGFAGSAQGQDVPARPPLQGPTVPQNRPPHVDDQFGEGMKSGKEGRREPMIPMRAYAEIIDKLRGDKVAEGLRLSSDQDQKISVIEQEFREAAKEFAQKMRQERGSDAPPLPAPSDGTSSDDQRPRREMAQELMKNGPKPSDYQTKIWAALNVKQQEFVKVETDKVRQDIQKKRGDEMMERRLAQKRGAKGDGSSSSSAVTSSSSSADQKTNQNQSSENAPPMRERAQKIMRRVAQLPPEDRERILKRLEDELDKRGIPNDPPPPPPQSKD